MVDSGQRRHVPGHRHRLGAVVRAHTDDKMRGRLDIITHLLGRVPYEPLPGRAVKLAERRSDPDCVDPDLPLRHIPGKF